MVALPTPVTIASTTRPESELRRVIFSPSSPESSATMVEVMVTKFREIRTSTLSPFLIVGKDRICESLSGWPGISWVVATARGIAFMSDILSLGGLPQKSPTRVFSAFTMAPRAIGVETMTMGLKGLITLRVNIDCAGRLPLNFARTNSDSSVIAVLFALGATVTDW